MTRDAPKSSDTALRIAALERYEILDTPTEHAFDEVALLASRICETPIAVINLIGEGRQFFKAEVGLGVRETPLETSFCAKAILEQDFLLVPDATKDARFLGNPLVTGDPGLRFYAGALLKTGEGIPIGTLCVLDVRPRDLSDLQQQTLRVLANQVMAQLDLRLALKQRDETQARHSAIVGSTTDHAIIATDLDGNVSEWNSGAQLMLGWSEAEMLGRSARHILAAGDHSAPGQAPQMGGIEERWYLNKGGQRVWASGERVPLNDGGQLVGYIMILRDRTDEKTRSEQLAASEARLRASQKAGQIGTFEVEIASGMMTVTPEFCDIFGVEVADHHPAALFESLIHPEDQDLPSNSASRASGGAITDVEYRVRRQLDDAVRWVARRAEFVRDEAGIPIRMFGTVQDITVRKRAERKVSALLDLGDRLRDQKDIGEIGRISSQILGETLNADRAGYGVMNSAAGILDIQHVWTANGVESIGGARDLSDFAATLQLLSSGEALAIDDIAADPVLFSDRQAYAAMATGAEIVVPFARNGDLTDILFVHSRQTRHWTNPERNFTRNLADRVFTAVAKVQAEADRELLNRELSHRLKNNLTMVQAIASQTLQHVTEREAVEALAARISALASAHDILLQNSWLGTRLDKVANGVLAPFGMEGQISVEGPLVELAPRAGLAASLLLNELATNAVKYGALSHPEGRVSISWRINEDAPPLLTLEWRERGGPQVEPPTRKGFGSRLISMGLVGGGKSVIDYAPDGLLASFKASVAALQMQGK